jgi:hypothetical protein
MSASDKEKTIVEESSSIEEESNVEFGGTDARKALEKKLLLKLDLRMSIMVVIYILNYVSVPLYLWLFPLLISPRSTETMPGMCCNNIKPNKASPASSSARLRGLQTDLHLHGTHCWIPVLSHLFYHYT